MPLRLGIIGAGHLGKIHARIAAARPDFQLVGVADPRAGAAEQIVAEIDALAAIDAQSGEFPVSGPFLARRAVADYRELIPHIDAAIVAAPTCLHFGIGRELLRRGVHVLMEKPLASSSAEADHLVALARKQGLVLQVGHIERFSPAYQALRGAIFAPRLIQASRYSGFTFRSLDIGVVLDLMVHDLDLAMNLARSPVQSVEAWGTAVMGGQEDLAHARLQFDNGCVALLQASRVSDLPRRTMEVWSAETRGRIDFADRSGVIARTDGRLLKGELDLLSLTPAEQAQVKERVFTDYIHLEHLDPAPCNPLADEQLDFLESIREGRDPQVTGEQGRDVVAVAERILNKIRSHERQPTPLVAEPHSGQPPAVVKPPHWSAPTLPKPGDYRRSA
ncbi:MAG: Gfo/Idh/MocA family oxidoreductase [Pirellulales bacterium]|nr:Gfo/Idh/MocA family oxidoreductase [Pirellulales bacterium]